MKGRKQKISIDTYLQKNRTESDGYVEGQTFIRITENNLIKLRNRPVPNGMQGGVRGQIGN
jgi:hypothetical protein